MSERISKLILETEFKTTGDLAPSVQKISELQSATKAAQGDVMKLVESEKKLEQAAAQAGVSVETQTKKQSEYAKTLQGAGKALEDLAVKNKLDKAFSGGEKIKDVNALLKEFEKSARAAKSVDELEAAVSKLMDALPENERVQIAEILEKELGGLAKNFEIPLARMKELRRLANVTEDPELFKLYTEEAGKLKNELDDTNQLIKALSSSSFFTDTLVEGAQTAVSAFTAFQGALGLVSDDQEELAKAAQKAQSALALLQGTQTLLNELKKSDNILTRAQIVWQKLYAVVVGESTGAMKGFRLALAATGIGAVGLAIAYIVTNWKSWNEEIKKTTFAQESNNRVTKKASELYVEEASKIEIAKQKLQAENLTKKERIAIVQDLQKQYPNYLGNLNAETASYGEIVKALDKVNQALLVKFRIQAAEEEVVSLQKTKLDLERQYQKSLDATALKLKENQDLQDINPETKKQIVELGQSSGQAISGAILLQINQLDEQIKSLIQGIVEDSSSLQLFGGDPLGTKNIQKDASLIEGTIAYLEAELSKISEKLTKDLKIGSDEFVATLDVFFELQKQVKEARDLLNKPTEAELFTAGSLKALRASASELSAIIEGLPDGQELRSKAEELRAVNLKIKELETIIAGDQTDKVEQLQSVNFDLLNEEERHQLAMLQIEQRGEEARIKTQLTYAQERLRILKESGTATEVELEQAKNAVKELEAELANGQKKFTTEFVSQVVSGFKLIVDAAIDATSQIIALKQQEVDQLASLQEQRIEEARQIADKGNAEILQAEEERLAKLQEASRNYARQQIALTQLQITAESALAIAKAAAQGGVAAPFTIAATLIALAAGYAQARAQASSVGAGFKKGGLYDGGFTGAGDPSHESKAQGFRGYKYHKNEYIMPSEVTNKGNNLRWFEKIRLGRIDLETLIGKNQPVVIVNSDNKDVVKAINEKPVSHFSLDKNGLVKIVESNRSVEAKRQHIKTRRK